jgi:hypothetical protein
MAGRVIVNGGKPAYEFEKITVSSSAIGISAAKITKPSTTNGQSRTAEFALITVETDSIRYRTDGTNPDSTTGHLLVAGDALQLDNFDDIRRFKAIRVTTDATIQVSLS